MKSHRLLSARQEALAERNLVAAIQTLRSVEECRAFLRDLCTPAELQAMADPWAVVECLRRGMPYREIQRQTGVSVTTIGRVARYLASGNGGYSLAAQRVDGAKNGKGRPPQARGAEVRPPDRSIARSARALRSEALARQGPAHGFRREHAARCAVRGRRRHPGVGAGRRLRSGSGGPQRTGGKAPGAGRARHARALSGPAHARFRTLPALPRSASRPRLWRPAIAAGQAYRHHLPVPAGPFPRATWHRGRDRQALRLRGDCTATRTSGPDLCPGTGRLDAAGQSPARSGDGAREPRGTDSHPDRAGARKE